MHTSALKKNHNTFVLWGGAVQLGYMLQVSNANLAMCSKFYTVYSYVACRIIDLAI
jgi:hypothetical protein